MMTRTQSTRPGEGIPLLLGQPHPPGIVFRPGRDQEGMKDAENSDLRKKSLTAYGLS